MVDCLKLIVYVQIYMEKVFSNKKNTIINIGGEKKVKIKKGFM